MIEQPNVDATPENEEPSYLPPKSLIDLKFVLIDDERDLTLSHKEAQAGSPADIAACGEEDNGSALEFLVTRDDQAG